MQTKYNETTRAMLEAFSEVVPPLNVSLLLYQVRVSSAGQGSSEASATLSLSVPHLPACHASLLQLRFVLSGRALRWDSAPLSL